jgi:hypothetical protein
MVLLAVSAGESNQGKKRSETYLDPDKAGPEFALQGEYEGEIAGKGKLAAQVVARGKGKFDVAFLRGGLPGAGWDGKTRHQASAGLDDRPGLDAVAALVNGNGWSGDVTVGTPSVFRGKTPEGDKFHLKRVVRKSPTEGARPPAGAVVLFDGSDVKAWNRGKLVEGHLLAQGPTTKERFRDFKLHVEFRLPFKPTARGQGRANSGVYLQGRYEIQILDSFGLAPKDNDCASIYEQKAPAVNLCYPPLSWQTYDVEFRAARFNARGRKTANAVVTVVHNGVTVHDRAEIQRSTGYGNPEEDTPGPLNLQDHGNPVYFRNVWLVPLPE